MFQVRKRDGKTVDFDRPKIVRAIQLAMSDSVLGIDPQLSESVTDRVVENLSSTGNPVIDVETIQDQVELELMSTARKDVAKAYILFRDWKSKLRKKKVESPKGLLSDEFISRYKHTPSPMGQLGNFVYYRTYSRWLARPDGGMEPGRREFWWETVRRAVEYNCSLVPGTSREEAERLYDNVFHLRQFLAGRTLWSGGTRASILYPMSNFNCAFTVCDNFSMFHDLFYILMIGGGVGVRILRGDVEKLPVVRTNIETIHKDYIPVPRNERIDHTSLYFPKNDTVHITVGDSKEGWVSALDYYFKLLSSHEYREIRQIIFSYDHVRPKGSKLNTFGGTSSGYESLKTMFYKIDRVIRRSPDRSNIKKLRPLDCLDIANIIGENVVSGGVRRTSEVILFDSDDVECIEAKKNLYTQKEGKWQIDTNISHRQMSNNSIFYRAKPTREKLHWHLNQIRFTGEPGFINMAAARQRLPEFNGVNPCAEILLDRESMCNLTTVNVMGFVQNGQLDLEGLLQAQRLSARSGFRMTNVHMELPNWDAQQKKYRLTGCSLTGWQDMVNATGMETAQEISTLQALRKAAVQAVEDYAVELNVSPSRLVTTLKPEGTLSQLPTVSSGIHYSHSPYFIRRVRISSTDPLVKVAEELEWPVLPEVGQDPESCVTKVIEFPVKAPEGRTKYDVPALEQLENYKMFMEHYVQHNVSITVSVRPHEWEEVEQWLWDNWDSVVAISFLPLEDSVYDLLPYEAISAEEYQKRLAQMKPFVPSLITRYEKEQQEYDVGDDGCETGICPVR
ncbi:MAG TPA: ribonucleoside-triphosphate reductase, adenosylcobalamin-dependent [Thermotogota bacterium]|nr:ribonucleoside-triphosphate reductase, adenosylcobalamin-dependent [Thermotogota bacterium]HRW92939.1 ribonucleoside-triphosphate reductase, adenosylcobalamin-dependent [Thermotogota bacterium]